MLSKMRHPESTQDETEVTLKTEAEAGASGYSVTGGGDQGIFIKQVLKDSSAAKLFSLREGDQLLSTTIFFDNIKYEDALKILQYSEPYKVQFKIKRKLPAAEDEEWAAGEAEHGPKGSEKQDQDVADGCTETPTKMLEGDGDQERLISKAREDRGRRPQRERLSWPKFQSIKTKRRPGPRRSHSSSEAYERGDVPDVSPTSTDTEAQLPAEERERRAGPGSQQKTRFLSLRFRMGSGKAAGLEGRGAPGGTVQAGVLEEAVPGEEGQGAAVVAADSRRKDSMAGVQEEAEPPTEPGLSLEGTLGEGAGLAPRSRKKKKEAKVQEETVPQRTSGVGAAPGCREEGPREGGQGLEIGIARLSLQEPRDQDSQDGQEPEFQIRIPTLKTPKFTFPKGKALGAKGAGTALHLEDRQGGYPGEDLGTKEDGGGEPDAQGRPAPVQKPDQEDRGTQEYATEKRVQDTKGRDRDVGGREGKTKMLKFKLPSFGWSPGKEQKGDAVKQPQETEKEENMLLSLQTDICQEDGGIRSRREKEMELPEQKLPQKETMDKKEEPAAGIGLKGHLPKVHVPGIKVPKVDLKAPQVDIKGPKLEVKGAKGEVTAPDLEVSLPSVEVDTQAPGAKLEGDLALGDKEVAAKEKKFKMPKFKMPSFGVSAPGKSIEAAVDVSLPKAQADVSLQSVQADVKTSDLSIELPPAELDVKAAEAAVKLPEGQLPEVELKEPAAGIGLKGHLPKVHVPGIKVDLMAPQVDIKGPKFEVKGAKGEVTAPDLEVSLPSVEVDTQAPGAKLEGVLALGDKEVGAKDSKFKMPKFKIPSFGVSVPGKSIEAAVDVSLPKAQADVSLSSVQADVKTSDLSIELPSAELDVKAAEAAVKLPEGHLPEVELKEPAAGIGLKGHLPKVHVPGIKVPKVDLKAPQVDIKGPKLEVKSAKGEVTAPDLEVSLPSVEVDTQAPGAKLEGVLALGDKEVGAKDSKFKMPKFKMPSFGVAVPGKSIEAAVDVSLPKAQADVSLPSVQADVKTSDLSIELPPAEQDVKAAEAAVKLPEGHLPEVELKEPAAGIGLKGHLPKVHVPGIKVPKVDLKAPQVDIKGPKLEVKGAKGEVTAPDLDVSLPSVEVDTQAPGAKLEGDLALGDKEVAAKEKKFKMPKFKMPSFGVSAPGKSIEAAVDVSLPKAQADVSLPSVQADVKTSDLSIELPPAELDVKATEAAVKLPEGHLPEVELKEPAAGIGLKGHLPKVHVPGIKVPKVDLKAPQVDIKGPKLEVKGAKGEVTAPDLEVSLPSVEVDTQAPGAKLEGVLALGDKEVGAKDSKFKMPKFKMPSFGVAVPGKSIEAAVDVSLPKAQADVSLPSVQADVKTSDLSIELPPAEQDVKAAEAAVKLPEGHLPEVELKEPAAGIGLKGHLPKVHVPGIKVPKVDLKAPQVDIKGPKLEVKGAKGEVTAPDLDVSLPSVEVDTQAPGAKLEGDLALGDKEVAAKEKKFKMPKFKMPSFGVSAPGKSIEAAVDVSLPKAQADVSLQSVQADVKTSDLSIELPPAELDVKATEAAVKLPEGQLPEVELKEPAAGIGLKGHLPKVHVPGIKVPKVDLKAPQVDIKGPKLEVKSAKGEVTAPDLEVSLPSVEVDTQAPGAKLEGDLALGDKEVAAKDSKFKMPKFKMPSFGVSAPGKSIEAAVDVSLPKAQADVSLQSVQADVKTSDLSIELPPAELDVKAAEAAVKLPEGHLPEVELKEPAAGIGLKGHLPKVHVPGIKVPKVDLKAPQVDIKGPKLEVKGAKGEVTAPDLEVSLPSVEVDTQAPGAKLEGVLALGDKEVAAKDSKFKMPKFKMPSFGVSAPGKSIEAAVDVSLPKAQADVSLPSVQADVKTSDLSIELPPAELDVKAAEAAVKLPEGHLPEVELKEPAAGIGLKGHLPKVHVPCIKVPKVDLKAPQVDIKGPKLEVKGAKGEVTAPDLDVSLPSVEVDTEAPGAKLEGDLALGDKEVAAKEKKFKMPKFKMPSFGVSAPGKSIEAAVDVSLPNAQTDVSLPSVQADVKTSDLSIELPPAELDVKAAEAAVKLPEGQLPEVELKEPAAGIGLKGHLPKVHVPGIKVPKVDLKAPQVDIKGPKLEVKSAKGEVTAPDLEVSLPSVEVDTQAPGAKLEGVLALGDKEVAAKDSKFKMPKFKMPSFGVSAPGKSIEAAVDVSLPKAQADVSLPSVQADVKTSDLSIELPPAELDVKAAEAAVKLPEGHLPEVELKEPAAGIGLKGHLPKVHVPGIKVPKVDLKAPQVDIKGPKLEVKSAKGEVTAPDLDVSLPSVEVDTEAPGAKLEGDLALGDKEVAAKEKKFKMPKFKMPSFGVSAPGKSIEAAVDVSLPNAQTDVSLPSVQADVKTSDLSIELPPAELDVKAAEAAVKLPEGQLPEVELKEPAAGIGLKGHLPKVHVPGIKVDLMAPQVDIKGPKLEVKGAKGEVTAPDLDVSLPSVEVDTEAPGAKLEGVLALGDKEVGAKDSKFKMPTFKMPSFGVSAPGKSIEAAVDVSLPKAQADVSLPSVQADVKTSDLSIELPSAELDVKAAEAAIKLPEGHLPEVELKEPAAGIGLKGHLPKVHVPGIKVPKVDLKAPQVDIKGPKLEVKGAKGEVTAPDLEVSLPSVEVDTQAPGAKLEGVLALGDKEVGAKDSKFHIHKGSVLFFEEASTKVSGISAEVVESVVGSDIVRFSGKITCVKVSPDHSVPEAGVNGCLPVEKSDGETVVKKSILRIPDVFSSAGKISEESAAVADSGFPVSPSPCAEPAELSVGVSCAEAVFTREPSLPAPRPPCPSFPSETLHLSRGQVESPTRSTDGGVTLTKYQVTLPRAAVPAELPLEPGSGSQQDACFPGTDSPALLQPQDGVAVSQTDSPVSPADPLLPPAYGRVTFPKFHRPKFGFSIPKAAGRELEPRAVEFVPTPSPPGAVWGPASAAEGAPELGSPGSQPPCSGVSVSGSADVAVSAAGEAMAEDADREGKGSPLKMLKFKLPSFRRSPKKGARPLGEPGHSLEEAELGVTVDTGPTCVPPGLPVAPTEVGVDAPLEKDVGEGATKTPGCAHVGPAPPRMQASVRGAGLPPGDPAASASRLPAEGDSHASQKASGEGGAGDTGTVVDLPEGVGVDPHLPQVHSAHLGFSRPDLRPSAAKVATSSASGPLPRHGLPLGDGSQGPGPGDTSASQPHVEVAAPLAGDPLSPSCGTADAAALVRQSPEEGAVAGVPGSQRGWFRAPALRLPGVQRPAEARGGEGLPGPPVQAPAASAPAEGPGAPGSEGTAPMSLQPPEAGAESTCGTDVLKRNLDIRGLELHCPPAQAPAAHLSTPEVRVRPGEGCLPLHVPSGRLSETQAPAGETGRAPAGPPGLDLAGGAGGAEDRSSQPEGPVRLRASSTGLPSQVSVVNMGQPWEGSVLTVKLPRLDMPRFTFPDPSSEADVFIPTVSEVRCPGSSLGDALRTQSPGDWGASILKAGAGVPGEQPVALDLSPEDSPISKVRVHIQGAQVESPEVTVRKVTAELEDLSGPEAFSTQIVRESEIPASKIQTASYGFSLLKVKIPEPPRQVRVQDPRPREGSGEASKRDAPEADPVSGDLQPDTGEPFEVIMSSTGVPERPAFTPEVCPGLQGVDSCSDEEAAEILDFPPEEDSGEAAACPAAEDRALQEKPEGKRSSGLFRSWLPNIGFSSSGEETCADPREEVRRSAPIQTQPGVPPEAQLPKKQEKAGWFRLPKLGFSSSPTKMSKSPEDEAALAEQKPQEEAITFFDARESFSPEDKEEGDQAEAAGAGPGTRAMVTPAARTELILLEQDRGARDVPAPGPATK
ncbi:protein AHNAK2 isoform X2 [Camelus bactrianus]|uniref:Protein AHNAK2 isoform X2 n=1 Tax=Camelus bactrianus TaxID=9837 RepID=A0AC58QFD8_CAMBA